MGIKELQRILIRIGQMFILTQSKRVQRDQEVSGRKSLNKTFRNRWLIEITIMSLRDHREKMQEKPAYKVIIQIKYLPSKENKDVF